MIFKQVREIVEGRKTQTRRVIKPSERPYYEYAGTRWTLPAADGDPISGVSLISNDRVKWRAGQNYAVVPKRGAPSVWWRKDKKWGIQTSIDEGAPLWLYSANADFAPIRKKNGFQPLRIRLTAIRQEHLQDISEADAQAEGVGSVEEYRELWQRINGKTKGARWGDNPLVWVITFEVAS